jgi:hypothetical protein
MTRSAIMKRMDGKEIQKGIKKMDWKLTGKEEN